MKHICQEHLFEHFKGEGHSSFLGNVSITLTYKTDGKDPKKRENYWMRTLKTYAPFELHYIHLLSLFVIIGKTSEKYKIQKVLERKRQKHNKINS